MGGMDPLRDRKLINNNVSVAEQVQKLEIRRRIRSGPISNCTCADSCGPQECLFAA